MESRQKEQWLVVSAVSAQWLATNNSPLFFDCRLLERKVSFLEGSLGCWMHPIINSWERGLNARVATSKRRVK